MELLQSILRASDGADRVKRPHDLACCPATAHLRLVVLEEGNHFAKFLDIAATGIAEWLADRTFWYYAGW